METPSPKKGFVAGLTAMNRYKAMVKEKKNADTIAAALRKRVPTASSNIRPYPKEIPTFWGNPKAPPKYGRKPEEK